MFECTYIHHTRIFSSYAYIFTKKKSHHPIEYVHLHGCVNIHIYIIRVCFHYTRIFSQKKKKKSPSHRIRTSTRMFEYTYIHHTRIFSSYAYIFTKKRKKSHHPIEYIHLHGCLNIHIFIIRVYFHKKKEKKSPSHRIRTSTWTCATSTWTCEYKYIHHTRIFSHTHTDTQTHRHTDTKVTIPSNTYIYMDV